ncbi:hypothetical protein K491DRAFT_713358 [Lophiostoma macrostomum CBS 122681]|uniref:Uncharacterized protein n=1 Tax=Lophiostoma macrostomum CBS 122681 TaxID=1314788 RepID=A0A6A6TJ71_9PLEO|nr:hypothetical protein K491DRAFT_713358 [Lophiostoma macrostomum CBS 122681]
MPSPLPTLFLTEAVLKIIGGSIFFFSPATILKNLASPPYAPSSVSLIRSLGTQTIAFSIPLFLASRSDAVSVRSRRLVYWTMLAREGVLGLGLGWQILEGWWGERCLGVGDGDEDAKALEEGLVGESRVRAEDEGLGSRKLRRGMWIWIAELVPFVVGRLWVLGWRGEWFEGGSLDL